MGFASIISGLLQALAKVFPFLIAYKGGGDRVAKNQAQDAVEKGTKRNEIDDDVTRLPDADLDRELYDGDRR